MQPKTKEKIKAINAVTAPKAREYTAAEQWDVLAYKLIQQTLAPKGYKEIKQGAYRGTVLANAKEPGLIKPKVMECQRLSAQLVRTFRQKALKGFKDRLAMCEKEQEKAIRLRDGAHFWQFKKKRSEQKVYEHYRDQSGLLTILINEIENLPIK